MYSPDGGNAKFDGGTNGTKSGIIVIKSFSFLSLHKVPLFSTHAPTTISYTLHITINSSSLPTTFVNITSIIMLNQGTQQGLLTDRCDNCRSLLQCCQNRVFGEKITQSVQELLHNNRNGSPIDMESMFITSYKSVVDNTPYGGKLNCNIQTPLYPPLCLWNGAYRDCIALLEDMP